jgi:hypothetical protein
MSWIEKAPCRNITDGAEIDRLFFSETEANIVEALTTYCQRCPYRIECFELGLSYETDSPGAHRYGIFGGTTPPQRASIVQRGYPKGADPMWLCAGRDTVNDREVPPIPYDGDRWSRHHTQIARKVVLLLRDAGLSAGDPLPRNTEIAAAVGASPSAMGRVLEALVADGTLDVDGDLRRQHCNGATRTFIFRGLPGAVSSWLPIHLLDRGET